MIFVILYFILQIYQGHVTVVKIPLSQGRSERHKAGGNATLGCHGDVFMLEK
jgi:hypothetical protein